jgi:EthD domain
MIKVVFLLRRQAHLTREEFLEYWHGTHASLARAAAVALRMRRYVQVHPVAHAATEVLRASRGARAPDFDGIAEAWWNSFEDMLAVGDTHADIAAQVFADEQRFVDLGRSEMWFGEDHVVYAADDPGTRQ